MSSPRRSADHALAAWCLVIGALAVMACSGGAPASPPATSVPSESSVVATGSTGSVTPSSATSQPPSAVAPIPDGDYLSGYVTKDVAKRMLSDPAIANDPLVPQFLDSFNAPTRYRLHLAKGHFTHAVEQEAGSLGIGEEGTYAFVDDHTVAFQGVHAPGTYKMGFTLAGDTLTWKVLAGPSGAADLATVRVVFEALPYIRQH